VVQGGFEEAHQGVGKVLGRNVSPHLTAPLRGAQPAHERCDGSPPAWAFLDEHHPELRGSSDVRREHLLAFISHAIGRARRLAQHHYLVRPSRGFTALAT
jgi:hypothetical protein